MLPSVTRCCRRMASTKPTALSAEPSQVPKVNQFGIPLLPDGLRERLFAGEETAAGESVLRSANELLKKFDLNTKGGEKDAARPPPSFSAPEIPPLYGNIESHFHHIAEEQVAPYCRRIEEFVAAALPPLPKQWNYAPGWTRYGPDGKGTAVAAPLEDTYAFDVEVLVPAGPQPILAAAVSKEAWYSWAAAHLVDEAAAAPPGPSCGPGGVVSPSQLIPVGEGARLIFGHNVSYDRARLTEEYSLRQGTIHL